MQQQNKTLTHVSRADKQDSMRQMTLNESMEIPGVFYKRVGRPRQPWIAANCKWIYAKQHPGIVYQHDASENKVWVKQFAVGRHI